MERDKRGEGSVRGNHQPTSIISPILFESQITSQRDSAILIIHCRAWAHTTSREYARVPGCVCVGGVGVITL